MATDGLGWIASAAVGFLCISALIPLGALAIVALVKYGPSTVSMGGFVTGCLSAVTILIGLVTRFSTKAGW